MSIDEAIMQEISRLGPEQKVRVLGYARSLETPALSTSPGAGPGVSGNDLLAKVGRISVEDAAEMMKIIEEDCERIDANGWK